MVRKWYINYVYRPRCIEPSFGQIVAFFVDVNRPRYTGPLLGQVQGLNVYMSAGFFLLNCHDPSSEAHCKQAIRMLGQPGVYIPNIS